MQSIKSVEEFNQLVTDNSKVVVDFWAEWCGPCRRFGPTFEQAAANETNGVVYVKVNIEDTPPLTYQYNVRSIPTIVYFKDNKEISRDVGTPASLEDFQQRILQVFA